MDVLDRFKHAQDQEVAGIADALAELRAGRKSGHWIWYVFPQLAGLGSSGASQHFGIRGAEEARAYLSDPLLRGRLAEAIGVVADQLCRLQPPRLDVLMGSRIDALKLVSSLTLFEAIASRMRERSDDPYGQLAERAGDVLAVTETQGYARCAYTRARLESSPRGLSPESAP